MQRKSTRGREGIEWHGIHRSQLLWISQRHLVTFAAPARRHFDMPPVRHSLPLAGLLILALSFAYSGVHGEDLSAESQHLIITGSSTIAPLMTELAAHYESNHPGVRIDVQSGGSSRGIADVRNGVATFGMVSRALRTEEHDLMSWQVARDGVTMIAHQSNPVYSLSREQVRGIYSGGIQSWRQLDPQGSRIHTVANASFTEHNDASITVVHKASGRATLDVFLDFFDLENPAVQADIIAGENEQAIKTVAADRRAIAYVSIGTAESDIRHGVAIKLLALNGITASTTTVADGSYSMARPLNVVALQQPHGIAKDFLKFIRSPQAADLIRAQSFTPLQP